MPKKQLIAEALIDLHRRLSALPTRSHERRIIMQETANLYGIRTDPLSGISAKGAAKGIAALRSWYTEGAAARQVGVLLRTHRCHQVRTSNKKGRHLSTGEAIRLIEEFGVETPDGSH